MLCKSRKNELYLNKNNKKRLFVINECERDKERDKEQWLKHKNIFLFA